MTPCCTAIGLAAGSASSARAVVLHLPREHLRIHGEVFFFSSGLASRTSASSVMVFQWLDTVEFMYAVLRCNASSSAAMPSVTLRPSLISFAVALRNRVLSPRAIGVYRTLIAEAPRFPKLAKLAARVVFQDLAKRQRPASLSRGRQIYGVSRLRNFHTLAHAARATVECIQLV